MLIDLWARPFLGLARLVGRLSRSNGSAYRDIGKKAAADHRWSDAIEAYEEHLKTKPRDGQTWIRLGNVLKDCGRLDQAEVAYDRAGAVAPESPDLWLNRGHLAKIDGRNEDATTHYRRSFRLSGSASAGRELLALAGYGSQPRLTEGVAIAGAIDGMIGRAVVGWAVNPVDPSRPARIEIFQSGKKVGEAIADLPRADVQAAGFGTSRAGFRARLDTVCRGDDANIVVRLADGGRELVNSPYRPTEMDAIGRWEERWDGVSSADIERLRDASVASDHGLTLSIVMPIYNPEIRWLRDALDSVLNQISRRWELVCVDDGSSSPEVREVLNLYASVDDRVVVIFLEENGGISRAVNAGMAASSGDYIAFMDHDDVIEMEAVSRVLDASKSKPDLIYTDEFITGIDINDILYLAARPSFSYDYYISHPYFVHFVAVRRCLAHEVGGFDESMSISMDVDFVLRIIERSDQIVHIPLPLYRWRTHAESAGHAKMESVMSATSRAIDRHHMRIGVNATVSNGKTFNTYRTDYEVCSGRVLVVVPTKDRLDLLSACVDSILSTTSEEVDILIINHESVEADTISYFSNLKDRVSVTDFRGEFNFSKMNNDAFMDFSEGYEYVLFLNNDVEAIEAGWLEHMKGVCSRSDVGVVGALLLYGDDRVQHGGVVIGVGGPAEHSYKAEAFMFGDRFNPGYLSGLTSVRDCMAVTGACMMLRTEVFREVGGFDERLAVGFNDIDLCLRVKQAGYGVLFDSHAVLHHYESATRSKSKQLVHPNDTEYVLSKWSSILDAGDPYFSPLFSRDAPVSYSISESIDPQAPVRVWMRSRFI